MLKIMMPPPAFSELWKVGVGEWQNFPTDGSFSRRDTRLAFVTLYFLKKNIEKNSVDNKKLIAIIIE